jgi:transcriptional regulator with XRE-family HTH domain
MLNKALRLIRVFHDQNQSDLAKLLEISSSYLSEIESGIKKPTIGLLSKYSEVFSIPPSSLLLFSEILESNNFSERARAAVAGKIVKVLEWVAAKEGFKNERPKHYSKA